MAAHGIASYAPCTLQSLCLHRTSGALRTTFIASEIGVEVASLDIRTEHRQTQAQTLSPRLQHAVRLLQMSSLDFAAMLRETLGKNPFLEAEDGDGDGAEPVATGLAAEALPGGVLDAAANDAVADEPRLAAEADADLPASAADTADDDRDGDNDRDLWAADGGSGLKRAEDGELSALDLMAVETSLNDHLHGQLN